MNLPDAELETQPSAALNDLTPIEVSTIDLFVRTAALFGVSKSVGEIYGLVFISASPLSLDDIRSRLKMSSGSASQGLRLLRTVGAAIISSSRPTCARSCPAFSGRRSSQTFLATRNG